MTCGLSSPIMADDDPSTEELSRRQLEQVKAAAEAMEASETEAETHKHERRAEKASYLREKLAEQQRADEETTRE